MKKLANSDNQPFSEMVLMLYSKSAKLITSILSILPKWIVFVALIFPITSSAFAQVPPEAVEIPLVIQVEQGVTLHIYSNKYVIHYCSPSYQVIEDTVVNQGIILPNRQNEAYRYYREGGEFRDVTQDNIFNRIEGYI